MNYRKPVKIFSAIERDVFNKNRVSDMKLLPVILVLLFLSSNSFLTAGNDSSVPPYKKYKNDTKEMVFLILELKPDKEFENKSNHPFKIINQKEFAQYSYQVRLQDKIDSLSNSLKSKKTRLDTLDKKYQEAGK